MKSWLARWSRHLHIYLSLLGLVMFLFFAISGILLTHDNFGWGQAERKESELLVPPMLRERNQLEAVTDWFRRRMRTNLAVGQKQNGEEELELSFVGPGRRVQINMDRRTGRATVREEDRGLVGRVADLHRGADTGWFWRIWMDVASVWIVLSSLTGLLMLAWLPKRQRWGLIAAAAGTLLTVGILVWLVPQ